MKCYRKVLELTPVISLLVVLEGMLLINMGFRPKKITHSKRSCSKSNLRTASVFLLYIIKSGVVLLLVFAQFRFEHEIFHFFDHIVTPAKEWCSLVQFSRYDFHDSIKAIRRFSPSLLCNKCHWVTFIK